MPTQRIIELLERYKKGGLTPEEQLLLDTWFEQHGSAGNTLENMSPQAREAWIRQLYIDIQAKNHEASLPVAYADIRPKSTRSLYATAWRTLPYVAATLVLATLATWFFWVHVAQTDNQDPSATMILPGGNRATLTLANGRTIDLSEAQSGIIVGDGITYPDGSAVIENGQLTMDNDGTPEKSLGTSHYQLSTPKGGTYQITLPDGTTVWLNAATTLKYPSRFGDDERVVELIGEAYFDIREQWLVAGDRSLRTNNGARVSRVPFKVITNGQIVEVLGTQFNISAYPDDPETKTTLVEGIVQITNLNSKTVDKLLPGQQASLTEKGFRIQEADVEEAVDWKNGYFTFNQTDINTAMTKIARWYDVEVIYLDDFNEIYFGGSVSRENNLLQTLKILESTGNMKFKIEGRRVIVMP